jgi:hypothetical protein
LVGTYEKRDSDDPDTIDIIEVKTSENVKTLGRARFELDKANYSFRNKGFEVRRLIAYFADTGKFYELNSKGNIVKSEDFK